MIKIKPSKTADTRTCDFAKQGVGWIKLQDRKPEDGQLCLVWIRAFPASDARGDIAYWNNGHGFESDHWFPEDVICWQPFPNPPTDVEL